MVTNSYIVARLDAIERELSEIRKSLAVPGPGVQRGLYGVLKGEYFTEEEIERASHTMLRDADADA